MKIWAHRGFSSEYPENTMLAFTKAYEAGADGIETDVQMSKDGKVVVIHDESLLRTCGVDKRVEECTFEELVNTRASRTKGDRFDATIPSFDELCAFIAKTGMVTNVEIKTGVVYYPGIEEKIRDSVVKYGIEDKVIFSSFNPLSLVVMKKLLPQCESGLLFESVFNPLHLSYLVKECGFQYLHPDFALVNDSMLSEAKACGLSLNVWTVDKEDDLKKLMEWGVNAAITNKPDYCLKLIGR